MPCKTTWERHGIFWQFYDEVTGAEVDRVNSRFYKDARRHDVDYQIIDATGVTSTDWRARDAHLIAAKDYGVQLEVRGLKLAFIAAHPDFSALVDEYIKISEQLETTWEFRRFDSLAAARVWVGADAAGPGVLRQAGES